MEGVSFCLPLHGEHCSSFRKGTMTNSLWELRLSQSCLIQGHVLSSSAFHWVLIFDSHTLAIMCVCTQMDIMDILCLVCYTHRWDVLIQHNDPLIAVSSSVHCSTVLWRAGLMGSQQIGLLLWSTKWLPEETVNILPLWLSIWLTALSANYFLWP